ncbi:TPR end-of-group domain-containing protein [Streptomyces sp. NPDC014882]|uniref:TPR end-of-group domain-containing protein n=1 Tax=Streptomyces sp. NPDC014882 TaxID=3364927 RepID=UPI00370335DE
MSGSFWSPVAQWAMVTVGLLLAARAVAFAVRPSLVWAFRQFQWWVFTATGLVFVLAVSVPWTLFAVDADTPSASRAAGTVALVMSFVAFAVLVLFLVLPDRIMSVPLPPLLWTVAVLLYAASFSALPFEGNPLKGSSYQDYVTAGVLTAAGVVTLGLGVGTRLTMRVTVRDPKGKEDAVNAAYVASRMVAMSHKPRGLASPQGTDVLTLPKEAVAALPSQGQLAVDMVRFGLTLFASAPWRADIVVIDGETATATLKRNSGLADSTIVYRSELGLDGFGPSAGAAGDGSASSVHDVLTGAAAFLLMRLSEAHPGLRSGLCGATRWRGLACQILAGTPPWQSDLRAAEQLFATAVDNDPGNDAARLGYLYHRAGATCGQPDDELRYARRVEDLYQDFRRKNDEAKDGGYLALTMRAARSLVYARRNCALLLTDPKKREGQAAAARRATEQLRDLTRAAVDSPDKGLKKFGETMLPTMEILGETGTRRYDGPVGPLHHYLRACRLAEEGRRDDALHSLELALGSRELRESARTDPSFESLLTDERHRMRLVDLIDQTDVTDIEAFRPYERELLRCGFRHPGELLGAAGRSTFPHLRGETLRWMREISRLVEECPSEKHAIAWTNLLTAVEIHDAAGLAALRRDAEKLQRVNQLADARQVPPLSEENIEDWVARHAGRPTAVPVRITHG